MPIYTIKTIQSATIERLYTVIADSEDEAIDIYSEMSQAFADNMDVYSTGIEQVDSVIEGEPEEDF